MLIAWDLHLPMKPRESRYGSRSTFSQGGGGRNRRMGRWDVLTRDEDDENAIYEEEDDDHWPTSDGDILGDVPNSAGRRTERFLFAEGGADGIPFEQRWEVDGDGDVGEAGQVCFAFCCCRWYSSEIETLTLDWIASDGLEAGCTGAFGLGE